MKDPMHDLLDAAEKGAEVVPLETAKKILGDALADLEQAEQVAAEALSDAARLEERLERLRDRETPRERFEQAVQCAHHQARHVGLWTVCPHPVCHALEDFLHAEAKDGAR